MKTSCDDCGVSGKDTKLRERKISEQEYPGAKIWTYTETLCEKCFNYTYPRGIGG